MPNPLFQPVIGQNFGDVTGQQFRWSEFNNQVDNQNLNRLATAQQTQNDWLLKLRQSQEQDIQRQAELDARAQEVALSRADRARSAAEDARRFDIGTGLTKDRQAIEAKRYQFAQSEKDKALQDSLDETSNFAASKYQAVDSAGKNHDDALTALNDAQQAVDTKRAQLQQSLPPTIQYDPKLREFKALNSGDTELVKQAADANLQISNAKSDLDRASNLYQIHKATFSDLHKEANQYHLSINKVGDKYVLQSFHPKLNRTWGAPKDVPADATAPAAPDHNFQLPDWATGPKPMGGSFPWTDPNTSTGTNPPADVQPTTTRALAPQPKGQIPREVAAQYLVQAGGDKEKARALASADGWTF